MRSLLAACLLVGSFAAPTHAETITEAARAIEAELGGRVGVALRRQGSAAEFFGYRSSERFPLSSTFKAPLCGAILTLVDAGEDQLDRVVGYTSADLVTYSPVTETRVDSGMSVGELCEATITLSDNTAGNLLLERVGGPQGLTEYLQAIGDETTRLDRWETDLNEGTPGDPRDTTTPEAMVATLENLLFGEILSESSREQLNAWMEADQVADELLRASLPADWIIGDKTGAGGYGSRSIIAVIRRPHDTPWLAAVYLTENEADMTTRNQAIARIGAAIVKEIAAP
ncbi:class A beta-lactamase [Paracoccus aerius]|uniref:Beta-lactamase n=1 Tax=Paracoccus aerius TaxID=1915382 RepID=A0ABS1S620_9RHOB|nr:class A beta-lactamase [Paracoccus aerius]MBL3673979.1 class A beta-lactamase [Paracoccus aerius]GHG23477.1 beta-lactamase [Paracoccus aerius]